MSSDPVTVSILIPGGGSAVRLRRTLASVLMQRLEAPLEILLLDEALPENGAGIARGELAGAARPDTALRILRPDPAAGPGAGLLAALAAARGRYCTLLPCDTRFSDPDRLHRMVAILDTHPDLAGVAHRTILRGARDGIETILPRNAPERTVLGLADLLAAGVRFPPGALLLRRRFAGQDRLAPLLGATGDRDALLYLYAAMGGIRYLPQIMAVQQEDPADGPLSSDRPADPALALALRDHGYLDAPGLPETAAHLAQGAGAPAVVLRPLALAPRGGGWHRLTGVQGIAGLLDLETRLSALTAEGAHEEALALIRAVLGTLAQDPNLTRAAQMRRLSSPELDWHCAHLGGEIGATRGVLPAPRDPGEDGPTVILVSGLAEDHDGPWAQTRDLVDLWRDRGPVAIVSSEMLPSMADARERLGKEVELLLNTDRTLTEKVAWLMWHLARLKPARILVNPAHDDVTIPAGLRREHAPRITFVDRCAPGYAPGRHSAALDGVVVRRAADMAYIRRVLPGRDISCLPLFAPADSPAPCPPAPGPLVTATAARDGAALDDACDYGLEVLVAMALTGGAARHVHLGDLSERMCDRIHRALIRHGVTPEAFVHLPRFEDVGRALHGAGAQLVLAHAPRPEPRTLIAAMSAGLPVIGHRSYLHPMFSTDDLCPPGSAHWARPEDLTAILPAATPGWIAAQAAATRAHMEPRRSARAMAESLGEEILNPVTEETIPPQFVPETPDELRRLLSGLMATTLLCD